MPGMGGQYHRNIQKRINNPGKGLEIAKKLYSDVESDLNTLSEILGKSDLKYKVVADKLAKELLQCGIDYFMDLQKKVESINNQDIDEVIEVFTYAKNVAVGEQTIDRTKDNIDALTEIKNREVYDLIHVLDEIIKLYQDTGYNYATGETMVVNEKKVLKFLKDVMTDDVLRKAASTKNSKTLDNLISKLEIVLRKVGRFQYTHSKVKLLSTLLSDRSEFKNRLESLAIDIKPNVGSVTAKADDATGGCLSTIAGYAFIFFIIWLLAMIFG